MPIHDKNSKKTKNREELTQFPQLDLKKKQTLQLTFLMGGNSRLSH